MWRFWNNVTKHKYVESVFEQIQAKYCWQDET